MAAVYVKLDEIPLLLVVCQCVVLVTGLLVTRSTQKISNNLLAVFIALNGLGALDALLLWSYHFRRLTFAWPNLAYTGEVAFWLQGPFLFWYTRSLMYKEFHFTRRDFLHAVPAVIYMVFLSFVYYRHSFETRLSLLSSYELFYSFDYALGRFFRHLHIVVYSGFSIYLIHEYRIKLKDAYSNLDGIGLSWLRLLIWGFLATVVWGLIINIASNRIFFSEDVFPVYMMGVIWNYMIFILINALVFYSLTHPTVLLVADKNRSIGNFETKEISQQEYADRIQSTIEERNLYLKHELTLDELAVEVNISPRIVSEAVNRVFNRSFFEYINEYRVKHAQNLLGNPENSVKDVMLRSGFNSKSAFNRFFKKITGETPTQYRKRHKDKPGLGLFL